MSPATAVQTTMITHAHTHTHTHTHTLTHSLTHTHTHSLTHSLTHVHARTHSLTYIHRSARTTRTTAAITATRRKAAGHSAPAPWAGSLQTALAKVGPWCLWKAGRGCVCVSITHTHPLTDRQTQTGRHRHTCTVSHALSDSHITTHRRDRAQGCADLQAQQVHPHAAVRLAPLRCR